MEFWVRGLIFGGGGGLLSEFYGVSILIIHSFIH